ncbi:MAG: hypothetical protein LBN09_06755 [Clostridioides sp.]|jgi:hypothetical protein|nr:hypothetical protein [Clostridioides sp.]
MEREDYRWKFNTAENIEESIFDSNLEKFVKMGINGLVRENCQNSLDAGLRNSRNPVDVKIKLGKISKNEIPAIHEIADRINLLVPGNTYTKETIEHMKKKARSAGINYISFEDSNTKGLSGASKGQNGSRGDTFGVYAYNKGVHSIEEDNEKEKARGGSHGVGKIANNAASDLNIMFFANCDAEKNMHIGGTVHLIEHKMGSQAYRATGYFTDKINGKFYPYKNKFRNIFEKDTRGLKIIIPYLRDEYNDEVEIIRSVCSNFFVAILENKLEVSINGLKIDKNTVTKYIKNKKYYEQNIGDMKKEFTPLYLDTYINTKPRTIEVGGSKGNNKKYKFDLYFSYNSEITKARTAVIRSVGMKIEDRKILNNATKPFNAILMPNSVKEDDFLKGLENESHTELSHSHIKDPELKKEARTVMKRLNDKIIEILDEEIKKNNPSSGIIDTSDIINTVEYSFKQEISKDTSRVSISKGNKKTLQLVKKNDKVNKPKAKKKVEFESGNEEKEIKERKLKKVKPPKDLEASDKDDKKEIYNTSTDMVERIVVGDNEYIKFDFKGIKELKKVDKFNLVFNVVDGMGNEYKNEFNANKSYNSAKDEDGKEYKIEKDKIVDVGIENGQSVVKLKLSEDFNRTLKFLYSVEV